MHHYNLVFFLFRDLKRVWENPIIFFIGEDATFFYNLRLSKFADNCNFFFKRSCLTGHPVWQNNSLYLCWKFGQFARQIPVGGDLNAGGRYHGRSRPPAPLHGRLKNKALIYYYFFKIHNGVQKKYRFFLFWFYVFFSVNFFNSTFLCILV